MINKEKKLLLLCARLEFNDCEKKIFSSILSSGIDWSQFFVELLTHRLSLLFFHHIKNEGMYKYVPRDIIACLKAKYNAHMLRSNKYMNELERINSLMNEFNIPYALTKGFYLINQIYKNEFVNVREFGDVDILVDMEHLDKVKVLLEQAGYIQGSYSLQTSNITKASRDKILYKKLNSHEIYPFIKIFFWDEQQLIKDVICIDVNFTIFEGGNIKPHIASCTLLGRRKMDVSKNNILLPYLSNEDNFLHLCYHLYMDTRYEIKKTEMTDFSLIKFLDLKSFLKVMGSILDWKYIENQMKNKSIYDAINFASHFLKIIYPEDKNIYFPLNLKEQHPPKVDKSFEQRVLELYQ